MQALLFDVSETFLRAAIAGPDGALCRRLEREIWSKPRGIKTEICARVLPIIVEYEREHRMLLADSPVVISLADDIHVCADLPQAIESAIGRKVTALNDMSAACWYFAETTQAERFAAVTVGSGIGSRLFDRCHPAGVLYAPSSGGMAHVLVDDRQDAPVCDCGGRGHLAAVSSGRAIERAMRRKAAMDRAGFERSSLVRHFGASLHNVTSEQHIIPATLAGDSWTLAVVRECTRHLIRSLLTVTMAFGLEKIYVMGELASALNDRYLELIRELAFDLSRYEIAHDHLENLFEVIPACHETCLKGCAAFLRSRSAYS